MRRDEVLQHVEAFAEVGRDRRLDDRAVGLRHESAHAGELPDLRSGASGSGVGHHVDRVERLLRLALAAGGHGLHTELLHHRLRDLIVRARPDVDHFVVALAVGDETGGVLVLNVLHLAFGGLQDARLLVGNDHVVHAERDTRTRRVVEARVHELVREHDGFLETELTIASIDRGRDRALVHRAIDRLERQAFRHDLGQERAANGRCHELSSWSTPSICWGMRTLMRACRSALPDS